MSQGILKPVAPGARSLRTEQHGLVPREILVRGTCIKCAVCTSCAKLLDAHRFALAVLVTGGVALRLWYRRWRARKIAENRRVEAPNSHYSSTGVQNQIDRERWGGINLPSLHPLNREEVLRLLEVVDEDGIKSLSPRDRLFLDNMTLPRMGV